MALANTLCKERGGDKDSLKEKITLSRQDQLNNLGYIARAWAHYNYNHGGRTNVHIVVQSECSVQTNPNQTSMHLENFRNCANQ